MKQPLGTLIDTSEPSPKPWVVARLQEPSTYQGISLLAALLCKLFIKDPATGQMVLEAGMGIFAAISVAKKESVAGRDY
jgi:hypothetical protein